MAISDEINKLQQDSLDLDLQKRLSDVKKNMKGLDSSTEKYNNLVKDVLDLQIKRLENQKSKLKTANLQDKIPLQNTITKMEKEVQRQIVSYTKYKLDTKANASLRNKTSVNLSDLENVFHEFISEITGVLGDTAKSSINLSQKKLFRNAINSKRDKQEAYHTGTTKDSESITRQKIAKVEVSKILESERELADTLKDAFIDIKETINSTESKREFDIQSEKFRLFVEILEKNRGVINDKLEVQLDQLIKEVRGESKVKGGRLGTLGGKYADLKADAERLGITEKITSAGNSLARGLGKIDSELGNFAEGILSGIESIDRFAQQLFKIPETFTNFKKFFNGLGLLKNGSAEKPEQIQKLQDIKDSVDSLGEKFTNVINEKTDAATEEKEVKKKNTAGTKKATKVTKEQTTQTEKQNKLMKVSTSLLSLFNIETSLLIKRFTLLKAVGPLFSGLGSFLTRYTARILIGAGAVYEFGKLLVSRTFIRSFRLFRTGIMSVANIIANLAKVTLPLLVTGLGALATGITALSTPVLLIGGALALATGAILLFPAAVKKVIDYIKWLIPDLNPFDKDDDFRRGLGRIGGWIDHINPFSSSPTSGQTRPLGLGSPMVTPTPTPKASARTAFGNTGQTTAKDKLSYMKNLSPEQHEMINEYAKKYNVDPNLVYAVIGQESSGKVDAVSPTGVKGLMQVTGDTGKSLLGKDFDRNDPSQNLEAGVKYLSVLDERYNGDLNQMMAEYNGGMDYAKRAQAGRNYSINPAKDKENDGHYAGIKRNYEILKQKENSMIMAQAAPTMTPSQSFLPSSGGLSADNQKLQSVTSQNSALAYQAQQQVIAKQAMQMATAVPAPVPIINQNISNGASDRPFTPVDLRNSESTFVRNMDNDFGLYR